MKPKPKRIAGPFSYPAYAFRFLIVNNRLISRRFIRRYYTGYYVIERSQTTIHPGSKSFRIWAKKAMKEYDYSDMDTRRV